ncbi:MAG: hypothetical protein LBH45_07265 [Campylobacteraceae bacterium]|nr:hypothetical protein [Campylobacteraceae bacterium]
MAKKQPSEIVKTVLNTERLIEDLARTVVKVAQEKAPVVTGELKASIDILSVSIDEAIVGHKLNDKITVTGSHGENIIYPIFVHEGTGPYRILPKKKRSLGWGGTTLKREHFARKVEHPGIKANPYFTAALESPEIDKVISKYGDDAVKNLSLKIKLE